MSSSAAPPTDGTGHGTRRAVPLWGIVAFAVVGGLAIGRFVSAGDDGPDRTAGAPAVSSSVGPGGDVASLEATVDARPDDPTAWRSLGSGYVRQAVETSDPAFYELAEQAFDRAEALAPGDPTILVGRGALQLSLHRFVEAETLGRRATQALPGNADALGVLVDAEVELGAYDDAAETLQAMLDARPGLPALARASYQRELRGDIAGAEEAMRQAVTAGGSTAFDQATVITLLGDILRTRGDLEGARASYDEALRLSPDLVLAQLGRAHVLASEGGLDEASAIVEGVVERFPAPTALFTLAELQAAAGDSDAEQDTIDLVRVTSALQEEAGQIVDLELALFEADIADDLPRAVQLGRTAYEARPANVFAADALAWALHRSGQSEEALPLAEEAVRLGTANPVLQYHAAEVFAANGDTVRAAEHLERALSAGPSFSVRHADAVRALAEQLGVALPSPR